MNQLDFLSMLPAEEKDLFLNLLEETGSIEVAVRVTMIVLADSEMRLARLMEGPVRSWLKIKEPLLNGAAAASAHGMVNQGMASLDLEHTL